MKVVKILGVVFGALFLLTGISLLAGAAVFNAGTGEFDRQLAEQGLAGPVEGTVTAVETQPDVAGTFYTVEYTDKQGTTRSGTGPVADGTTPPAQGDDVQVYYSTADPSQIIIYDFPGANFAGVAGLLRTIAIVCIAIGAVLLVAGIIGLVTGRRRAPAVAAGAPPAFGTMPPPAPGPDQAPTPGQEPPPGPGQAPPPAPGPEVDPTPTSPFPAPTPQDPTPPETNRPGG